MHHQSITISRSLVCDGAHDARDVIQRRKDDECDQQAVQPSKEIAEPAAQRGDRDLDLRPDQIDTKVVHSEILLFLIYQKPPVTSGFDSGK